MSVTRRGLFRRFAGTAAVVAAAKALPLSEQLSKDMAVANVPSTPPQPLRFGPTSSVVTFVTSVSTSAISGLTVFATSAAGWIGIAKDRE